MMTTGTTSILPRAAIGAPRARADFHALGARLLAAFGRMQERARMRRMLRLDADRRVFADLGISPAQATFEASRQSWEKS